jgi:hypothetical protein
MKTDWSLTAESFEKFLAWLSPDREEATAKFQQLEKKLLVFFSRGGCHVPEELFDRTIDRACKKIDSGAVEPSVNPVAYCHGVARNVLHEYWDAPKPVAVPEDVVSQHGEPEWNEQELLCLEACLARLVQNHRDLVRRYYECEKKDKIRVRRQMSAEAGGANVLRIKVFRIRNRLRDCVVECINKRGALA